MYKRKCRERNKHERKGEKEKGRGEEAIHNRDILLAGNMHSQSNKVEAINYVQPSTMHIIFPAH